MTIFLSPVLYDRARANLTRLWARMGGPHHPVVVYRFRDSIGRVSDEDARWLEAVAAEVERE